MRRNTRFFLRVQEHIGRSSIAYLLFWLQEDRT